MKAKSCSKKVCFCIRHDETFKAQCLVWHCDAWEDILLCYYTVRSCSMEPQLFTTRACYAFCCVWEIVVWLSVFSLPPRLRLDLWCFFVKVMSSGTAARSGDISLLAHRFSGAGPNGWPRRTFESSSVSFELRTALRTAWMTSMKKSWNKEFQRTRVKMQLISEIRLAGL